MDNNETDFILDPSNIKNTPEFKLFEKLDVLIKKMIEIDNNKKTWENIFSTIYDKNNQLHDKLKGWYVH